MIKKKRLKKIVIKLHASNKMNFFFCFSSSIVNEGIRAILNLFIIFFFTRRFHTHKKHKKHKNLRKAKKA